MPHHRAVAIVDLALFPGGRHDHGVRLGGPLAPQHEDKAADAGVLGGEAVIVDEVAPDRHGVTAAGEGRLDQLAIRLARAGRGRASRRSPRAQRAGNPWRMGARVGGHLYGRFCRGMAPPARGLHGGGRCAHRAGCPWRSCSACCSCTGSGTTASKSEADINALRALAPPPLQPRPQAGWLPPGRAPAPPHASPAASRPDRLGARRPPSCLCREASFVLIRAGHLALDGGGVRA